MVTGLCIYKDALGKINEGVHSYRLGNIAILDVVMTIIGALLISYTLDVLFWKTLGSLFVTGIILHRIFCVRTTVDKLLF
jgi:hypothetical protein